MSVLWHNDELKSADSPVFRADDRIRLGDGVFDTMLAVNGHPIQSALHFERLKRHAAVLGIQLPFSTLELEKAATDILERNGFEEGRYAVNTVVSRGPCERGLTLPEKQDLQVVIKASPAPDEYLPAHAVICEGVRRNEGSPLSRIKSLNYGDNILAMKEAKDKGANEAILLNNQGHVCCAAIGNIFIVRDEELITPPLADGVLDGITRALIIEKYGAKEQSLSPEDLHEADGLYITNSIRGAVPVLRLSNREFPSASFHINMNSYIE